ncbi:hypothetical protein THAOC_05547 [Thalassiosira oceanica]|uniref:Helicase-associated domain-containing protein n=1 Tax=Thalassiosira oceanica TaxID=159749 RepID=K0T708_THAOC|nr:hypothetical protein THAOC_05547 [Thalassiosira oceanica]|eukprot:EJK72879.1 hypothetical protein THAOC_05547 [Thalassiosira oceanica]
MADDGRRASCRQVQAPRQFVEAENRRLRDAERKRKEENKRKREQSQARAPTWNNSVAKDEDRPSKVRSKVGKAQTKWNARYLELEVYKKRHGHCNVPAGQSSLGGWVNSQRKAYKKGNLSKERVQKLDALGLEWSLRGTPPTWDERFDELKNYKTDHGHCNVPVSQGSLGGWVQSQRKRTARRTNQLSKERVQKLDDLGFEWSLKSRQGMPPTGGQAQCTRSTGRHRAMKMRKSVLSPESIASPSNSERGSSESGACSSKRAAIGGEVARGPKNSSPTKRATGSLSSSYHDIGSSSGASPNRALVGDSSGEVGSSSGGDKMGSEKQQEVAAGLSKTRPRLDRLKQQHDEATSATATLGGCEKDQLKAQVSKLEGDNQKLVHQLAGLETTASRAEERRRKAEQDLDRLKQQYDGAMSIIETLNVQNASLVKEITETKQKLGANSAELKRVNRQLTDANSMIEKKEFLFKRERERERRARRGDAASWVMKMSELKDENQKLIAQLADLKTIASNAEEGRLKTEQDLEKSRMGLNGHLETLKSTLTRNTKLTTENARLVHQINDLEQEKGELNLKVTSSRSLNGSLRRQLEHAKDQAKQDLEFVKDQATREKRAMKLEHQTEIDSLELDRTRLQIENTNLKFPQSSNNNDAETHLRCRICTNMYGGGKVPILMKCCGAQLCVHCFEASKATQVANLSRTARSCTCDFCRTSYHSTEDTPWVKNIPFIAAIGIEID